MVLLKPDNIEWQKMQTRKRILQEWKKSFKVRLVFAHSNTPMEVRETFKKDLQVTTTFTLRLIWCYPGRRKISIFPSKKLNFFFPPCRVPSLLLSKAVYHRREEYEKTDVHETKKKPFKISVERHKNWGKKCKFRF